MHECYGGHKSPQCVTILSGVQQGAGVGKVHDGSAGVDIGIGVAEFVAPRHGIDMAAHIVIQRGRTEPEKVDRIRDRALFVG